MVTNALRVHYHPAGQTALAHGTGHLTEGSDSSPGLLSHVAEHMLALQGGASTAHPPQHLATAAAQSWLLHSPPHAAAALQALHCPDWGGVARQSGKGCKGAQWRLSQGCAV